MSLRFMDESLVKGITDSVVDGKKDQNYLNSLDFIECMIAYERGFEIGETLTSNKLGVKF